MSRRRKGVLYFADYKRRSRPDSTRPTAGADVVILPVIRTERDSALAEDHAAMGRHVRAKKIAAYQRAKRDLT